MSHDEQEETHSTNTQTKKTSENCKNSSVLKCVYTLWQENTEININDERAYVRIFIHEHIFTSK